MSFPPRLPIPKEVLDIARKLEAAGHESWCVGGAVRDNLLGLENKDFDLATSATPEQVRRLFRRSIPIGVEHGTVAVLDRKKQPHEVTTFRRDVATDGRHAVVEFGVSLDEDLARRDFTINAIAYHPFRHEWRDPHDGEGDLERKVVRAVGDAARRFQEDYLRILRALRFAARFGFEIDAATWDAAKANREGLKHLSAERVRDEWFKGLAGARKPSEFVRLWWDAGAIDIWLPELGSGERGAGLDRLALVDRFGQCDPVLITSYLSADPVNTLSRLRCSNADVERGRRIGELLGSWPSPASPVEMRRWMSAAGTAVDDLIEIAVVEGVELEDAVEHIRQSGAPLSVGELAIDGNDLLEMGMPEGPEVGEVLRKLLDRVLENPELNTKAHLLEQAVELARSAPAHRAPRTAGGRRAGRGRGK